VVYADYLSPEAVQNTPWASGYVRVRTARHVIVFACSWTRVCPTASSLARGGIQVRTATSQKRCGVGRQQRRTGPSDDQVDSATSAGLEIPVQHAALLLAVRVRPGALCNIIESLEEWPDWRCPDDGVSHEKSVLSLGSLHQ
jgi:hypothetical protein